VEGRTGLLPLAKSDLVNTTATFNGTWYPVVGAMAFGLYIVQSSVAGTPQVSYYLDASPYRAEDLSSSSAADLYVSQTIATNLTTESTMIQYSPTLLNVPVRSVRIRAIGGASNPADSLVTALLAPFTTG
jgi:hypothetical protein